MVEILFNTDDRVTCARFSANGNQLVLIETKDNLENWSWFAKYAEDFPSEALYVKEVFHSHADDVMLAISGHGNRIFLLHSDICRFNVKQTAVEQIKWIEARQAAKSAESPEQVLFDFHEIHRETEFETSQKRLPLQAWTTPLLKCKKGANLRSAVLRTFWKKLAKLEKMPSPTELPSMEKFLGEHGESKKRVVKISSLNTGKPDPEEFYVDDAVWRQLRYNLLEGRNVLLVGPSGTGKTEIVNFAASSVGKEVCAINMGATSEPNSTLLGNTHYSKEKGTYFIKARFIEAIESGEEVPLLDELSRATPAAFNILLPVLDGQREIALDESDNSEVVKRNAECTIFATANIGIEYTGTEALDKALLDRFSSGLIEMTFPPEVFESKILRKRCGVTKKEADLLTVFAAKQRKAKETKEEYLSFVSTRMLLETAKQIVSGVPAKEALEFCIFNHFEKEESSLLKQLAAVSGLSRI